MKIRLKICLLTAILLLSACAGDPLVGPIGNNVSGPISIALDPARNRAYLLNSDLNAAYLDASLMVLDISSPKAPTLLNISGNPIVIPSLSGQVFFDASRNFLFFTNRFSENEDDVIDTLFQVVVGEGSSFGQITTYDAGENPFGLICCDANDQMLATSDGFLQVFPRTDPGSGFETSLELVLSNGGTFNGDDTTRVTILGNQAFLSNRNGIVYVINLDKINSGKNAIDYAITNMQDLRGITTDGSFVYVADVAYNSNDSSFIRVIDPAAVPAIATVSNAVTEVEITDTRDVNGNMIAVQSDELDLGSDTEPTETLVFGSKLYVADIEANVVYKISISNPANLSIDTELTAGDQPFGLAAALFGSQNLLYVTNLQSDNVSIIDIGTNQLVGSFP